ncbi:hypothetical protein ACQW02_24120 [Humitalea sp. 24SJ18S-53]|uniref:hypothetical protein n=1 Tax=Humitalea sp. 24SJ18S-53 TaxID=3422307 RepID=UPI003D669505
MSENKLKRKSGRLSVQVDNRIKRAKLDISAEGLAIKDLIEAEFASSSSDAAWTGVDDEQTYAVLTGDWQTYRFDAGFAVKTAVQVIGLAHGCHTCLTHAETDRDQPWTGDHCPPTQLPKLARDCLETRDKTYLFPQCKRCSDQQAPLVAQISNMANKDIPDFIDDLTGTQKSLLTGTKSPHTIGIRKNCVAATGPFVSPVQGLDIQTIGGNVRRGGCHTCGTEYPCPYYIADHVVPKFLVSEGFRQLFLALDIELPDLLFRPQCQRCSNGQGGAVSRLAVRARAYGQTLGIVFDEAPTVRWNF